MRAMEAEMGMWPRSPEARGNRQPAEPGIPGRVAAYSPGKVQLCYTLLSAAGLQDSRTVSAPEPPTVAICDGSRGNNTRVTPALPGQVLKPRGKERLPFLGGYRASRTALSRQGHSWAQPRKAEPRDEKDTDF